MDTVLTVDAGTSSVRASAVTADGRRTTTRSVTTRELAADQVAGQAFGTLDPLRLFSMIEQLIREVVMVAGPPSALAVSAQLGTVFADHLFEPVVPATLWQDQRAHPWVARLNDAAPDNALERTGRRLTGELAAPKMARLRHEAPEAFARIAHVLSLKDWLVARLTGEVATDPTHASYTMLFDVHERCWSAPLLDAWEIDAALLPPVVAAETRIGEVSGGRARSCGLPAGCPVVACGPDGTVGALGGGAVRPGVTVDIAGTTDVIVHVTDRPVQDTTRRSILNAYLTAGHWSVGGPTGQTGGAIEWLARLLGFDDASAAYVAFGDAIEHVDAGAEGVSFQTTLGGERFPGWDPDRIGAINGLGPSHGPEHLLRAAIEGGAFVVREGLSVLSELNQAPATVHVVGGAARRRASLQLRADAWGIPVRSVTDEQATTTGAAVLACVGAGLHGSVVDAADAMISFGETFSPDEGTTARFDEAFDRWRAARS